MMNNCASISVITLKTPDKLYVVENGFGHILRDPGSQVRSSVPWGYFGGKLWDAEMQWKEARL